MIRLVTAKEKQRASVRRVLEDVLAEADNGAVVKVMVIGWRDDNCWTDWVSESPSYCDLIGKLEVVKQFYLRRYFETTGRDGTAV